MDELRLKESFTRVAAYGDEVALFFYSHLFLSHPELRGMFPVSMTDQRDRLLKALGQIVADVSNHEALLPYLGGLGRDHRKFGTLAEHYPAVGASLLATLAHFNGMAWTEDLARDWTEAYTVIAQVMTEAAADDETRNPPWWGATVAGHERRTMDISVLKVTPDAPLSYVPGQSVAVESEARPRLWRFYSMANAPRHDGTIDFHVRAIDGGSVSAALARSVTIGSRLRLGPPVGTLRLNMASRRNVVLAAGSTGLAPLKAMIEQAADLAEPPGIHLVFGARTIEGLYDLADLEKMAAQWPWLTVTPAVSAEPEYRGETGTVADVITRRVPLADQDMYVCGSPAMVTATVKRLQSLGMPQDHIHVEDFGWSAS
ncbi:MAG TPA: globin domain-containing protein [Trebonia sp.]|nr:globin domain-containing protein [Trebonia sp.]